MSNAHESIPIERLRLGPVKMVEVFTSSPPPGQTVTDSLGNETIPFSEIRDLISDKPLLRPLQAAPGR